MKKTELRQIGIELGKAAFARGVQCAPCLDKEIKPYLQGEVGSGLPVLEGWHRGWALANLAAPVEF